MILLIAGIIAAILLAAGLILLFAGIGLYKIRLFQVISEQNCG